MDREPMDREIIFIINSQGFTGSLTVDDIPYAVKLQFAQLMAPAPKGTMGVIWTPETRDVVDTILDKCLEIKQSTEALMMQYNGEED